MEQYSTVARSEHTSIGSQRAHGFPWHSVAPGTDFGAEAPSDPREKRTKGTVSIHTLGVPQARRNFLARATGDSDFPLSDPVAIEEKESDVSRIARQRAEILAGTDASREVLARLEILNSQLTKRFPRVTLAQVEMLESVAHQVKDISQRRANDLAELAKRFGE